MERLNNTAERGIYDTAIKDISGIKDFSCIFKVIEAYLSGEDNLDELINTQNAFDIRTEKGRKKVTWAINKAVLEVNSQNHRDLVLSVFKENVPFQDKKFAFFWQLCVNNRLIREISSNVFVKVYYSGRVSISQDDIIGYIKDRVNGSDLTWSDDTVYRVATKYLSLMTKLDFVNTGRIKSFKHIRPSSEAQVVFLYFAKLFSPNASNILTNELLHISFIPYEDIQDRLKKLSLKGLFNMNFNGVALNLELTHSYKGICDVLYN